MAYVRKYGLTLVLLVILGCLMVQSYQKGGNRSKLDFASSLDVVFASVEGTRLTLRDLAFYVEREEAKVQEQAYAYNPEKPSEYWNTHVNGVFISSAARKAAVDLAVHDEIFYQLALGEHIELTEEEKNSVSERLEAYWSDLEYDGKTEGLGITKSDMECAMLHIAYAQKMQEIYAALNNREYEEYDVTGEGYLALLEDWKVKVYDDVVRRIRVGFITVKNV